MQENNLNLDDLHGKHLAMIATVYEDGESETAVFTGIAHWTGEQLLMLRGEDQQPFEVQSEWFERIRLVKEEIRSILRGAEYCFTVSSLFNPSRHTLATRSGSGSTPRHSVLIFSP